MYLILKENIQLEVQLGTLRMLGAIDVRHELFRHQAVNLMLTSACKTITYAEVNEIFQNLCRSSFFINMHTLRNAARMIISSSELPLTKIFFVDVSSILNCEIISLMQ